MNSAKEDLEQSEEHGTENLYLLRVTVKLS